MTDCHLLTNRYRTFTLRTNSTGLTLTATIILLCSPQDRNQTAKSSTMYQGSLKLFRLVNPKSVYSFLLFHFGRTHSKGCCPTFPPGLSASWLSLTLLHVDSQGVGFPFSWGSVSSATLFSMVVIIKYTGLAIPKYIKPIFQSKVLQQQTARVESRSLGLE